MEILRTKEKFTEHLSHYRESNKQAIVGFVPTMGSLHQGHLSLVREAREKSDLVVASIFVNPTQFNSKKDLEQYPIETEKDSSELAKTGVDLLFLPTTDEIYPEGIRHLEHYNFGTLESIGEGAHRSGHFQGVGQVLSRLINIIQPHFLFMGQKDYQQILITEKLLQIINSTAQIVRVNTVREGDGLAMSSRNARLSPEGRKKAPELFKSLQLIKEYLPSDNFKILLEKEKARLDAKGFRVEYLELSDTDDLVPIQTYHPEKTYILTVAAWLEGVRLIDNLMINHC